MKKLLCITVTIFLVATWSFAADFSPSPLKLTIPDEPIIYPFDGTSMDFTFDLSGAPAALWLVINTKLSDAEKPVDVRNGFMDWHYVNKIDTTVYVSSRNRRDQGTGLKISWNGHSNAANGGGVVAPGQYTYYLWGYDDQNARVRVSDFSQVGFRWEAQYTKILELGEDGLPLPKPIIAGAVTFFFLRDYLGEKMRGTHYKWEIGSDPHDESKVDWTHCADYIDKQPWDLNYGCPIFDPNDFSIFYHAMCSPATKLATPTKWKFVSDGNAIMDNEWGGWDNITWDAKGMTTGNYALVESMYTDGDYIYVASPGQNPVAENLQWDVLRCMDFDGDEIYSKMMTSTFYNPEDTNPSEWYNGEFNKMFPSRDGGNKWVLGGYLYCRIFLTDLTRLLDDSDDETDMILWENSNGDYFMDHNWNEGSETPWTCIFLGFDETSPQYSSYVLDRNNFLMGTINYCGLTSFCIGTQDGTGIGYMSFADDTVADNKIKKDGGLFCSYGSNYDGIYFADSVPEGGGDIAHTNWIGSDSVKGIITNEITAVEDEEVAKFSVDQNSPNPFNPTTAIGFNLVEDGKVTIDIFNVAGQKIDTLVNDFMSAGKHSVVWDANGFSAGVYFYTIKSGDFSKTMKMTLLK